MVFSKSLEEPLTWATTTLVRDEAVEVVRAMKEDGSGLLSTIGGPAGVLLTSADGSFKVDLISIAGPTIASLSGSGVGSAPAEARPASGDKLRGSVQDGGASWSSGPRMLAEPPGAGSCSGRQHRRHVGRAPGRGPHAGEACAGAVITRRTPSQVDQAATSRPR